MPYKLKKVFKKHSDSKIVEGIIKGDTNSINYLYESYFDTVKSHILKNSGTEDDAYDVFQDTLMAVYKKIQQNGFELTTDLKAYVFGVARNIWYKQLSKKKHTVSISIDFKDDLDISEILDIPIDSIIQRSFLKLKDDCQQILDMHLKGYDYNIIAIEMSFSSIGYAKRKKYLCKEALIKIIKSDPDYSDFDL